MKKVSKFYLSRHRKPKDLVKQMEMIDVENERQKLRKIVSQRKQKWKQVMTVPQLSHPDFNYTKNQYKQFSNLPCNASQEPFITEKVKRKLATSNRAYSSTPNCKINFSIIVKTGTFDKSLTLTKNDTNERKILNQMFLEYNKTIDQQTPGSKVRAFNEIDKNIRLPQCAQKKNTETYKKIYFDKLTTDRYNFYKINDYHSIPDLLSSKCKTDRMNSIERRQSEDSMMEQKISQISMKPKWTPQKSRLLQLAKLKRMNSNSTGHDRSESLDLSILSGSRHSLVKQNKEILRNSKNCEQTKSRIMTQRLKLSKANSPKNLNSMEY